MIRIISCMAFASAIAAPALGQQATNPPLYCASLGKDKSRFADSAVWSRLVEEQEKKHTDEVKCVTEKLANQYKGAGISAELTGDNGPVGRLISEQLAAIAQVQKPETRCKAYSLLQFSVEKARAAGFKTQDEGFTRLKTNQAKACSGQP